MNSQESFKVYYYKIYSFLKKYLKEKSYEAKKNAPEAFYFIKVLSNYVLKSKKNEIEPKIAYLTYNSLGGKDEKGFLNLSAALFLVCRFYEINRAIKWNNKGLKNKLIFDIFKKYKRDKSKSNPLHITFSQNLILGDIVSGFSYELILISKFSNEQKIKIFEELNEIIKWRQIDELLGKPFNKNKYLIDGPRKIGVIAAKNL